MAIRKKRRFDAAFFAPPSTTVLRAQPPEPVEKQLATSLASSAPTAPQLSDEAGLDAAYASPSGLYLDGAGTLFVAGTRGGLLSGEWRENYATMGIPLVARALGLNARYNIEDNKRYQAVEQFLRDHPGAVKNMVGHSKAAAVIDVFKKNHPEFAGKARLYSTPFEDPLAKEGLKDAVDKYKEVRGVQREMQTFRNPAEEWLEDTAVGKISEALGLDKVTGMRERGTERIANSGDFAALLDASATRTQHTNPLARLFSGGAHDYHDGVAQYKVGFDESASDRPGGADAGYRSFYVPEAKTPPPPPPPSGPERLTE